MNEHLSLVTNGITVDNSWFVSGCMCNDSLTERARDIRNLAAGHAQENGRLVINTGDLLVGLTIGSRGDVVSTVLKEYFSFSHKEVVSKIVRLSSKQAEPSQEKFSFSPKMELVFKEAGSQMAELSHNIIGSEHLLLGLLKVKDCLGFKAIGSMGCEPSAIQKSVLDMLCGLTISIGKDAAENLRLIQEKRGYETLSKAASEVIRFYAEMLEKK